MLTFSLHLCQNDKRYLTFDHVPDQRERWLRVSSSSALSAVHSACFPIVYTHAALPIGLSVSSLRSQTVRPRTRVILMLALVITVS